MYVAEADGTLVRVKDIGRVELGSESYGTASRYQARDAVGFGVLQLPTANALQVFRDVSAEIDRLSKRFPPGLKIEIAFDTTTVVSESIREVVTTLIEAIALVVLVMFLFLQNWRTTLIPAITIRSDPMHAWLFENPVGVDALQWKELPTPQPKAGEVLVEIKAASLNFPDLLIVQNK